jgi:hypothetical protein
MVQTAMSSEARGPVVSPRASRRRGRSLALALGIGLAAAGAVAAAPRSAHAQTPRRVEALQFVAVEPPFMPTATLVRVWLQTHQTDAIPEDPVRHVFQVYIALVLRHAVGAGPFTLRWDLLAADGSHRTVATESFTYDQPRAQMFVRALPLPATADAFEPGREYEVTLSAGGRDVARGRVRLVAAR